MSGLRPLIGIVNLSSNVSNDDVIRMVVAIQDQLKVDVAPSWDRDYWFIMFYTDPKAISPRAYPVVIIDNDTTPAALGWHAEQCGKPYGKIITDPILKNGGVILYDTSNPQNISIASVLSHEIIETFIDPHVNLWIDGPRTAKGSCYAVEACDPVENILYKNTASGVDISVSNFVLPAYFDDHNSSDKFDFLGILAAPFTLAPSGHMIVRNAPNTEKEVFGKTPPAEWIVGMKSHKLGSRSTCRMSSLKSSSPWRAAREERLEAHRQKWWKYLI